jgi:hypothetical protein
MIKRVTSVQELCAVIESFRGTEIVKKCSHFGRPILIDNLILSCLDGLLFAHSLIYVDVSREGGYSALMWWVKDRDERVNVRILSEYIFISKDGKSGWRLFLKSIEDINERQHYNYDVIAMGNSNKNIKLKRILERSGFKQESEVFFKNLSPEP